MLMCWRLSKQSINVTLTPAHNQTMVCYLKQLVAGVAIFSLWLDCSWAATDTVMLSPASISVGKAADITLNVSTTESIAEVYLNPGGPYIKQSYPLAFTGTAFSWQQQRGYIAAQQQGLATIELKQQDSSSPADASAPISTSTTIDDDILAIVSTPTHAWLAGAKGVHGLDIRLPQSPHAISYIKTSQPVSAIALANDRLAFSIHNHVFIFDVSVANKPKKLASHVATAVIHGLVFDNDQLLLALGEHGIKRYRLKDMTLQSTGHYPTTGPALAIASANGIVAVATAQQGATILASDNDGLHWLGSHQQLGNVYHVELQDQRLLAVNRKNQLFLLDVQQAHMPSVLASFTSSQPLLATHLMDDTVYGLIDRQLIEIDFTAEPPQYHNEGLDFGQGVNYGGQRRIVIDDNIAYVADWFSGIHLYDISQPSQPRLLASHHTPGSAKGIAVRDGLAYVADDDHGLQIIDVRKPQQAVTLAELPTPGLAYIPVIEGNRLYLAGHRGGFQIIDITDPARPQLIGQRATPGKSWGIRVQNNTAYVADDDAGLMMFDVSDPAAIEWLGQFNPGGNAEDIVLQSGIAYVAFFDKGVYIIDVRDPGFPKKLAHIPTPGNARGLAIHNNTLTIADWLAGVHRYDISQPKRPVFLGSYDSTGAAWGVAVQDDTIYVADWWGGFKVLDASRSQQPQLLADYSQRDTIKAIALRGHYAFAANGRAGLQIFDINNPLNPTWMTGLDMAETVIDISLSEQMGYAALAGRHLAIIDLANPFAPQLKTKMRLPYQADKLVATAQRLLVANHQQGLTLYDIDGKRASKPKKITAIKSMINDFSLLGDRLYVATPTDIRIYDLNKPYKALSVLPYPATHIATGAGFMAVHHEHTLQILDLQGQPLASAGREVNHSITFSGNINDLLIAGNELHLLQDDNKLITLTLDENNQLQHRLRHQTLNTISRMTASNDIVYLAGGPAITAIKLPPASRWQQTADNNITLSLPATLAQGAWDLHIRTAAESTHHNALHIRMPSFAKPAFTLDDLKATMQRMQQEKPAD